MGTYSQTKRDKTILRAIVRHWVRLIRAHRTQNSLDNLRRIYTQRHHLGYDHSPIPCPYWIRQESEPCNP